MSFFVTNQYESNKSNHQSSLFNLIFNNNWFSIYILLYVCPNGKSMFSLSFIDKYENTNEILNNDILWNIRQLQNTIPYRFIVDIAVEYESHTWMNTMSTVLVN